MIWISVVFVENQIIFEKISLNQSNSYQISSEFYGKDIGFYKVYMPDFSGEEIFIQILDINENVVKEEKIKTKMSVGYFDYSQDGKYFLKVTNLAKNKVNLEMELGDTNSKQMTGPGIMIFVGILVLVVLSFFKIKNYNIAQPDENIS